MVDNVSINVRKGEVVGIYGLMGAGRTETMEAIFGAVPKSAGQVFIHGKEVNIKSPYSAIKSGLGMLTENRRGNGFAKNFTCKENISLVPFIKSSTAGGVGGLLNFADASEEKIVKISTNE